MLIKASGARARPNRKPPSHQQLAAAQRAAKATRRRLAAPKKAPLDELGCHHFKSCSGCTLNQSLDMPPALQSASEYFQQHGVSYKLDSGPQHHWRHRAKLAVQPGLPGEPARVGLFRQGSHEVVDIPDCV
jgi:tRNA/tmRNA/rRNA uracil-C5-methylase (TrmA/RlmC/RlmD family)